MTDDFENIPVEDAAVHFAPPHPATYSVPVIACMLRYLLALDVDPAERDVLVVDPFAGTGQDLAKIAELGFKVIGVELEPEWAACSLYVIQGDATDMRGWAGDESIDVIFTSPSYGNRLADVYRTDATAHTVLTYAQKLGRPLTPGSGAATQWGPAYRRIHAGAIAEWNRVLRPGGAVILNMSDHTRGDKRQHVCSWWVTAMLADGFMLRAAETIRTRRFRKGRNGQARIPGEQVFVFAKPHPDNEEL